MLFSDQNLNVSFCKLDQTHLVLGLEFNINKSLLLSPRYQVF